VTSSDLGVHDDVGIVHKNSDVLEHIIDFIEKTISKAA
jgi:hypothetical protein